MGQTTSINQGKVKDYVRQSIDSKQWKEVESFIQQTQPKQRPSSNIKQVKIYVSRSRSVLINWNINQDKTCGWLLSQVIREIQQIDPQIANSVVQLKTRNNLEAVDHWLTQFDKPLQILQDNQRLELILGCNNISSYELDNFEIVKVIGKGGFSKVLEIRRKSDGLIFALKCMNKQWIKKDDKVNQIMCERTIMQTLSHPFLVSLHSAFQSESFLHLVMDFCPGGELFYHLHKKGRFPEPVAKFIFAEVLLALEYLHDNHIMYRDLKPENILIDLEGHIKITDFGLSKNGFTARSRSSSFCGSPEYMSPEMLGEEQHGLMVDFYSLGALLYELLTGLPPHYSTDRQEMYRNIIYKQTQYPQFLSVQAKSMLSQLLTKDPNQRLGCKSGASEVKAHAFCKSINWDDVINKRIPSPLQPNFYDSNFDPEYTSMPPLLNDDEKEVRFSDISNLQVKQESPKVKNNTKKQGSPTFRGFSYYKMHKAPSNQINESMCSILSDAQIDENINVMRPKDNYKVMSSKGNCMKEQNIKLSDEDSPNVRENVNDQECKAQLFKSFTPTRFQKDDTNKEIEFNQMLKQFNFHRNMETPDNGGKLIEQLLKEKSIIFDDFGRTIKRCNGLEDTAVKDDLQKTQKVQIKGNIRNALLTYQKEQLDNLIRFNDTLNQIFSERNREAHLKYQKDIDKQSSTKKHQVPKPPTVPSVRTLKINHQRPGSVFSSTMEPDIYIKRQSCDIAPKLERSMNTMSTNEIKLDKSLKQRTKIQRCQSSADNISIRPPSGSAKSTNSSQILKPGGPQAVFQSIVKKTPNQGRSFIYPSSNFDAISQRDISSFLNPRPMSETIPPSIKGYQFNAPKQIPKALDENNTGLDFIDSLWVGLTQDSKSKFDQSLNKKNLRLDTSLCKQESLSSSKHHQQYLRSYILSPTQLKDLQTSSCRPSPDCQKTVSKNDPSNSSGPFMNMSLTTTKHSDIKDIYKKSMSTTKLRQGSMGNSKSINSQISKTLSKQKNIKSRTGAQTSTKPLKEETVIMNLDEECQSQHQTALKEQIQKHVKQLKKNSHSNSGLFGQHKRQGSTKDKSGNMTSLFKNDYEDIQMKYLHSMCQGIKDQKENRRKSANWK